MTKVLDHGYVEYVEHWGSDWRIVEAARMSTGKGFLGWGPKIVDEPCPMCEGMGCHLGHGPDRGNPTCDACGGDGKKRVPGDEKLLAYLRENRHTTPFEMAGMIVEVQAPIMVFREWHRHRTQSYNEMSARYTPLPDLNYVPTVERLLMSSKTNRQDGVVQGADELTEEKAEEFRADLKMMWHLQQCLYERALQAGVPKELARVHLGVGRYSRMRASANLKNWLDFMTLRSDSTPQGKKAQYEIRQYANAVGVLIAEHYPRTWALFAGGAT